MIYLEKQHLHAYHLLLAGLRDDSRENFRAAFAASVEVLGLSDLDIARVLQISRPTVGRWTRGEAAPHPVGRKPILEYLLKRVQNGTQEKD